MSNIVSAALLLFLAVPAARLGVSPVPADTFRLVTPAGEQTVEAAERFVDVSLGDFRGAVVVFFEPKSRLFSWVFGLSTPGARPGLLDPHRTASLLYLVDERLVFFAVRHNALTVRTSAERAVSIDEAINRAVSSVEARKAEFSKVDVLLRGIDLAATVDLKELGRDFFVKKQSVAPGAPPQVVAASFANGTWEVTLRGPNNDRVVVTLDGSFGLQGTRRVE
jgi:hypothetical protein